MTMQRVSGRELAKIHESVSGTSVEIIASVSAFRYLTTRQIARLHFSEKGAAGVTLRSVNRALARLRDLGLLYTLERRVGGVRAGSGEYVWGLGNTGARLLDLASHETAECKRVRALEPSMTFLAHRLAVAEVHVRLVEAARCGAISLLDSQCEPACWKPYTASHGVKRQLKPDLAVTTAAGEFEDDWFIEVDLATEPPSRVVRKCLQYQDYRRTGEEQRRAGVFPAVVWIVPSSKRRDVLRERLAEASDIPRDLFVVILLEELKTLLRAGFTGYVSGCSREEDDRNA